MNENNTYNQPGVLPVLQTKGQTRAFYDKTAKVYDLLMEDAEESVRKEKLLTLKGKVFGIDIFRLILTAAQASYPGHWKTPALRFMTLKLCKCGLVWR